MKKVADIKTLEFDKSFLASQLNEYAANERGMRVAAEILHEVIENELTPRQRQLIRMKFFENKCTGQIALETGLDASTVSRTITRAQKRIYRVMKYYIKYFRTLSYEDDDC